MELRYAFLTSVLLGTTCIAQWANPRPTMHALTPASDAPHQLPIAPPMEPTSDLRDGGDVVWQEDFANGLAGNNGIGPWTVSGPNGNIWKRTTGNPVGALVGNAANARIQSTTVSNGYMLFNSDSANCLCTSGGLDAWPADPTSWDAALESPTLDLSATPFVELQFQQRLRWCCQSNPHFIEVSTDGGTTWPVSIPATEGIGANTLTATLTSKFNLSNAIAANPGNVKFRFKHEPTAPAYHWQIDDVRIVELYEYDLRMTTSALTAWNPNTAISYDSIAYSVFPYSQLRPLGLNMTVLNNGSLDQDDVVANFTVSRGGTTVLDQDQAVPNFMAGETRTIFVNPGFTPPAETGTYTVDYTIASGAVDEIPGDNSGTANFAVSQYTYGRDRGTLTSSNNGNGDGGALIMCNAFYINNSTQLHGISFTMANTSELGSLVVGELRADNLDDVLASTDEIVVTQSMFSPTNGSNFVTLQFSSPVDLVPGIDYMACIQVYGTVAIGTNGVSEPQTSFIYYEGSAGEDWYFTTTTPMIRMTFDPTLGIEETDRNNGLGLGQNFPNPANGNTTIPYDLERDATVSIQLHDVSGKLVMEQHVGRRTAGTYRIELATEHLNEGVYFYTLKAGEASLTKRMTVIR